MDSKDNEDRIDNVDSEDNVDKIVDVYSEETQGAHPTEKNGDFLSWLSDKLYL